MKKKTLYIIMCLVALLFASCSDKDGPMDNEYGISLALNWADSNDVDTEIKDIRIWVLQADGKIVVEKQYATKQEAALDIYSLDDGEYVMVTAVNLVAPFSIGKASTSQELLFKLDEASASPAHAHYGVTMVSVKLGENTQATLSLRRVLSELSIKVEGTPQGTTLAATINNVADGILPLQKDVEGNFGLATSGHKNSVTIPQATTTNGSISTQTMRLMPTITEATRANTANSHLHFVFTHADGSTMICDAEAPVMNASGKYILNMKYSELKAYMRIDPIKINDWEEGWIVSGEILNPDK